MIRVIDEDPRSPGYDQKYDNDERNHQFEDQSIVVFWPLGKLLVHVRPFHLLLVVCQGLCLLGRCSIILPSLPLLLALAVQLLVVKLLL